MNCRLPGSSVNGTCQARILEWVAVSFSRGSSQSRDWTHISCIAGGFFTVCLCHQGSCRYRYIDIFLFILSPCTNEKFLRLWTLTYSWHLASYVVLVMFLYWAYFGFLASLRYLTENLKLIHTFFLKLSVPVVDRWSRLVLLGNGRDTGQGFSLRPWLVILLTVLVFHFLQRKSPLTNHAEVKGLNSLCTVQTLHLSNASYRVLPHSPAHLCLPCFVL